MNSKEYAFLILNHKKADKIPIDIGGMVNLTSLHKGAYSNLLKSFGYPDREPVIYSVMHQSILVDEDVSCRCLSEAVFLHLIASTGFLVDENKK